MSDGSRPRIRALVLDARRDPSPRPLAFGLAAQAVARPTASARFHESMPGAFGAVLIDSPRYQVLIEHFQATSTTRDRVARARGVDIALVIAGQKNGVASRDLKLLHACGCRRALLLVPPHVPDVVVENLGRHLLLGARFDADEMPVVQLATDPERATEGDIAAILDAVDRAVEPPMPGTLLATSYGTETNARIDVLRGALVGGAELWVHESGRLLTTTMLSIDRPLAAGDEGNVRGPVPFYGEVVLAHEELRWVSEFGVAGLRVDEVPEMCFAFGGRGGFSDGRILAGRVRVEQPIAPVDGRVGLVRFQGAGLGPVQSVEALP